MTNPQTRPVRSRRWLMAPWHQVVARPATGDGVLALLPDTRLPDYHAPGADDLADLRLRLHLADRRHGIAGLVERASAIIDRASQQDLRPRRAPLEDRAIWQQAVDAADRALAVEQATRSVERGLGIDL